MFKKILPLILAMAMFICMPAALTMKSFAASAISAPEITVTKSTDNGYIKVKWEAVSGANRYKVYVREPGEKNYECEETLTQCEYKYYPEESGTYRIKVAALNAGKSAMSEIKKCTFTFDFEEAVLSLDKIDTGKKVQDFVKKNNGSTYTYNNNSLYIVPDYKALGSACDIMFVCAENGTVTRSLLWGSGSKNGAELINDRCINHCEAAAGESLDPEDLYNGLDDDDDDNFDYESFLKSFSGSSSDSLDDMEFFVNGETGILVFTVKDPAEETGDAEMGSILSKIKKNKKSALNSKYITVYNSFTNPLFKNIIRKKDITMYDEVQVLEHSSIRITGEKTIYFDPFHIKKETRDADYIFITHEHYDHFSPEDIAKVKNENTVLVMPESMTGQEEEAGFEKGNVLTVNPGDKTETDGIVIEAVAAYNINKTFHPKEKRWVGYVVYMNNKSYFVAGDTDANDENEKVKCDVAIVPVGGTYTMNAKEAAELVNIIKPETALPSHYGSIVGSIKDAETFEKKVNKDIKVRR